MLAGSTAAEAGADMAAKLALPPGATGERSWSTCPYWRGTTKKRNSNFRFDEQTHDFLWENARCTKKYTNSQGKTHDVQETL